MQYVSLNHAVIEVAIGAAPGFTISVRDLNSTSGTFLDRRNKKTRLQPCQNTPLTNRQKVFFADVAMEVALTEHNGVSPHTPPLAVSVAVADCDLVSASAVMGLP